jgi:photosystem II stability/assembly factor-like uncharacterized protein
MTPSRDAHSLRAALEEVTPAAPHLVHTVMDAVRAAEPKPAPRRATGWRLIHPAAGAALLAVILVTLIVMSAYLAGSLGLIPAGGPGRSAASTVPTNGHKSIDSFSVGSAVSASEAWIVQSHTSVYETQPGWYTIQPGTTPFSIVSRTTDGGRTWAQKLRFNGMYESMRFSADGRRGVIWLGTLLYRTQDGGQHWSIARTPDGLSVYAMNFLDPDHGWAFLYSGYRGPLTVYATSDGGQTWEARGGIDLTGDPTSGRPLGLSSRLQFSDAGHGLFVPTEMGTGWPVFMATDDGGQSWQRVGPAIAPDADTSLGMSTGAPAIFANGSGVLLVIDSANRLYVYSTTDHGMTWSGPRRMTLPSTQAKGQVGQRIWTSDSRHWLVVRSYVVGNGKVASSRVITTTDAGQHWTSLPSSPPIVDVVFASPTTGWAMYAGSSTGNDRLARTIDAGAHWTTVSLPPVVDS